MKSFIAVTILTLAVNALCIWDIMYTKNTFKYMSKQSSALYQTLLTEDVTNPAVTKQIYSLDKYWTKHMDILCISISRKDLQPISDYLQFLTSSVNNNDQETAITYSLLLEYNVDGLEEISGFKLINIL